MLRIHVNWWHEHIMGNICIAEKNVAWKQVRYTCICLNNVLLVWLIWLIWLFSFVTNIDPSHKTVPLPWYVSLCPIKCLETFELLHSCWQFSFVIFPVKFYLQFVMSWTILLDHQKFHGDQELRPMTHNARKHHQKTALKPQHA